jgi:nucleotide-binding universal stress UspA family protein
LGARVVALHALEPVVHAPVELVGVMPIGEIQEDLRVETERWLGEEAREAGAHRDLAECQVTVGEPVHEILEAIERERADLVVIGSRGAPSPVSGILGGIARAVLRDAKGPVLVVGPLGR